MDTYFIHQARSQIIARRKQQYYSGVRLPQNSILGTILRLKDSIDVDILLVTIAALLQLRWFNHLLLERKITLVDTKIRIPDAIAESICSLT